MCLDIMLEFFNYKMNSALPPCVVSFFFSVDQVLPLLLQSIQECCWGILAITLRIVVDPPPQICAGILHLQLSLPVQLLVGQAGVGREVENVTLSTLNHIVLQIATDNGTECLDHLEHSATATRTQVPSLETGLACAQVVERSQVTLGKIAHVDVVADSGSVTRGVVFAEHKQLLALTSGDLAQQRQQVEGDTLGVLTHNASGVSTARVEVTQVGTVPLFVGLAGLLQVVALGIDVVLDDLLNHELGPAVGVCWASRAGLGDGDHVGEAGGVAIDGSGRGEDDVGDIVLGHGAQQGDAAANIDTVVLQRDLARLANSLCYQLA